MSLLLATAGENLLTDTFLMARRQTLFPQLATGSSGTWTWLGASTRMFGGGWYNSSGTNGDYLEWANVVLQPGTYKVQVLALRYNQGANVDVYFDDMVTPVGTLDLNTDAEGGAQLENQVVSDTFTVSTKTRGTLRLVITDGNSGDYRMLLQQIEIVKISADSDAGTSLDDLPWVVDVPPVAYDSASTTVLLNNGTSYMWGSEAYLLDGLQNSYLEYKVWLAKGTYDFDMVARTFSNRAIVTVAVNGSDVGTMDFYAASGSYNVQKTVSSISIATTGVHTVRITAATKNASSSGYYMTPNWLQFRKTTTTGAITATGTTYGRETMELWPWFADTGGFNSFTLSSSILHYGALYQGSAAINNYLEWDTNVKSGSYDVLTKGTKFNSYGILHLSNNGGADLDTVDCYEASVLYNQDLLTQGSLSPGSVKLSVDSKNASASTYQAALTMTRLTRTGA